MATDAIRFLHLSVILLTALAALSFGAKSTTPKRGPRKSTTVSTEKPVLEDNPESELNPGIIQTNDARYLTILHEELILDGLGAKLKNSSIPPLNGSMPLIFSNQRLVYRMEHIKVVDPEKLEVKIKVNLTDGHVLQVDVPEVTLKGDYSFVHETALWKIGNLTGNFTITLNGITVICNREMTISNKSSEVLRFESANCSAFIDDLELVLHDTNATNLVALTQIPIVKQHIIDWLLKVVNYFTDLEVNYGHDRSKVFYIDMSLLIPPSVKGGRIVLCHRGEIRFRNETSDSKNLLKLVVPSGLASVQYDVSLFTLSSYCELVQRHKMLDSVLSQDDLPVVQKHLLSTEDVENGFGRLFPKASQQFQNASVSIEAQTTKKPLVTITRNALRMIFYFRISVFANVTNSSKTPIFTADITTTYNVSLSVTRGKVVLHFSLAKKQEVADVVSKIGTLKNEDVLIVANQVFAKNMGPFFQIWATEGIQLSSSKTLHETHSQWEILDHSLLLSLEYERRLPQKTEKE